MPLYLDTSNLPIVGIGICARCCFKFPLIELHPDPNSPGLMVCRQDMDQFDPYRLPPPPADIFSLPFARPDATLTGAEPSAQESAFPVRPYLAVGPDDPFVTGPGGLEIDL
jgi:hypothetical protein